MRSFDMKETQFTSVSSVFCKSEEAEDDIDGRLLQNEEDGGVVPNVRCSPAFSLSESDHDKIVPRSDSISKRFESSLGVARKVKSMLLTSRLSTLLSVLFFRSRLSASMRCSFKITPVLNVKFCKEHRQFVDVPSCRSLPIKRFFSFTSFSSSWVFDESVLVSSNFISAIWARCLNSARDCTACDNCDS